MPVFIVYTELRRLSPVGIEMVDRSLNKMSAKQGLAQMPAKTLQQIYDILDNLSSSVFVALLAIDGKVIYMNRAVLGAIGRTQDDVVGTIFQSDPVLTDVSARQIRRALRASADGIRTHFELSHRNIDGGIRITDTTAHPIFDANGKIAYTLLSGYDITERKVIEQTLHSTHVAIDRAKIALLQVSADGHVHDANDAACELLGYPKETLCGMSVYQLSIRMKRGRWPRMWAKLKARGSIRFELTYFPPNGGKVPIELAVSFAQYEHKEHCFVFITNLSEHKEAEEHVQFLLHYDQLTGLPNRASFISMIERYLSRAQREHLRGAVVIADIDRFWIINDTLGRPVADQLLQQIAQRITHDSKEQNRFARLGADQFAIVIVGTPNEQEVEKRIKHKLRQYFGTPFFVDGHEIYVSAKFGIALLPMGSTDAELLLRHAEIALAHAKKNREQYLFYTQGMADWSAGRLGLENKLRRALERQEFILHYQPKVNLESQHIEGVEALIRWKEPQGGSVVQPMHFIPLLEETGMLADVDAWVLRKAAQDYRWWKEQGLPAPRVAVNISSAQLRRRDFVQSMQYEIANGPHGIDLEITESIVMADVVHNIDKLKAIHEMGVEIAVDDFGTGYSSLSYLIKLPVQTVKIDRSFVSMMLQDSDTNTLVAAIISLAHALRLKVVAEGVETQDQTNALRLLGCDQVQGFFYSKPLSREDLSAFLQRRR